MGQVPNTPATYGIVGDGRAATHVAHYFRLLNLPFRQWSRRAFSKPPSDPAITLQHAFAECSCILVLIKDSEIESFINAHSFLKSKTIVHFSGSLVTNLAIGFHPLFSFGEELCPSDTYQSIPFVCERGRARFHDVFPALPNPYFEIDTHLKPFYHALCVLSGNFTTLLWQKMFSDLERRLQIPVQAALPYLHSIVRNLEFSADRALTGPLARKDVETLRRNLAALDGDPFQRVFHSFVETVAPDLVKEIDR